MVEHTEGADSNQWSVQCRRKGGVGDDPNASGRICEIQTAAEVTGRLMAGSKGVY
jgi:hypothetical protein